MTGIYNMKFSNAKSRLDPTRSSTETRPSLNLRRKAFIIPEDGELGSIIPRVNRWLAGVETAMKDDSSWGEKQEKYRRWSQNNPSSCHWMRASRHLNEDFLKNNPSIECLNLENPHLRIGSDYSGNNNNVNLTLPKIQPSSRPKQVLSNSAKLEVMSLEDSGGKCPPIETGNKGGQMESFDSTEVEQSQSVNHLSITDAVNQLSFDREDDEGFSDDEGLKSGPFRLRRKSTGSMSDRGVPIVPKLPHPTTTSTYRATSSVYDTIKQENITNVHIRTTTTTTCSNIEEQMLLPPLRNCDCRRHSVHEVPTITVCQEEEHWAGKSKDDQYDSSLDPRFLMPTESSVQESRYLLNGRRGSFTCVTRMRRKSLDMVAEELREEHSSAESSCTAHGGSLTSSTLRVPRHRNRSHSLDGSLETETSFAAFKKSLKMRTVKKSRLGS